MVKVGIIGHFGFDKELLNGQTVKTKSIANELSKLMGDDQVLKFDTHGGVKALVRLFPQIKKCLREAENVIILPANRGLRIIVPLLFLLNKRKKRKTHYVVIGGWLPDFCKKHRHLAKRLKRLDYIYVETSTMKKALDKQGFSNVVVMPNFKNIGLINTHELRYCHKEPFKICTFSRVMKEKGIEDVVNAVKRINSENKRTVYNLDIYGDVDSSQLGWFESLSSRFPAFVKYKGSVGPNESVDVVKNYFALAFPTKFYTEGIPGTIIDAYSAGVPVIASKWESFYDLVDDGETGIGYEFNSSDGLVLALSYAARHPDLVDRMKENCLKKACLYLPSNAIRVLVKRL